jgi:hypothetical protein
VSIKIISCIVHACQLHNNLLLDFVFEKKASATGYCFFFISILIMDGGNDECYVYKIILPKCSSSMMMMMMMMMTIIIMTGARVDLCNKSALLREEKRQTR